jgi:hypothetical protein
VTVQSSPGVGSQFIVALPIAREEPVERAALSEPHGSRA